MPVTWLVLDSLHADYAAVLSALDTATANKYTISPAQVVRSADHDANIKLVSANLDDDERTGSLAPISRDKYGDGVYKDEYGTISAKELEAFSLLGESGRKNMHYEQPYHADGSWDWSIITLPDSDGSGRTYGDRIVGWRTGNGPLSAVAVPLTATEDNFFHGFWIAVWEGSGTVAGFSVMELHNGQDADNRMGYHFNHWLKPGALSGGTMLQIPAVVWVKDSITNAYSLVRGSGPIATLNKNASKFYDPDFRTLEYAGELTSEASIAAVKATPGTFFYENGAEVWWVHMPDGSNPQGRVVGTGPTGYFLDFNSQLAAETEKQYTEWFGFKGRMYVISMKPLTTGSGLVTTIRFHTFHMLNLKYGPLNTSNLIEPYVQGRGSTTSVTDIEFNIDQVSRGQGAYYMISQDGESDAGLFARITVQADVNARDGRENIFDIGAVPWEEHSDNHAVGIQMVDTMTVQHLKIRRCGGSIVGYFRNLLHPNMNQTNRPVKDILIANNDVAEHGAAFTTGGSNAVGIAFNADNALQYPVTGCIMRDNIVRGYDTDPAKAMTYCICNLLPDQVIMEGNDCDLAVTAQIDMGKNVATKWVLLTGSAGNWNLDDFIEDDAAPGTKIGRIIKIVGSNPTVQLHYCHPTGQTLTAQDIATGVAISNQDDTGTGTTDGANSSRSLGPNTKIRNSTAQRTRLGNSGATALWVQMVTGAPMGGTDATERLTGGAYLDEQNTDYVGLSSYAGISITTIGTVTLADYQAASDSGNVYGTGSVIVAP